jgi:hypothetical protein
VSTHMWVCAPMRVLAMAPPPLCLDPLRYFTWSPLRSLIDHRCSHLGAVQRRKEREKE